ncbi:S-layer homology domain-containing protein [Cohnella yongneupensis]|uniref:S-layer homology domain-containing protein n=1 Tax=Cohnella yongneupensis TaxID=425006 RepID=A0ABW0R713_9BACL
MKKIAAILVVLVILAVLPTYAEDKASTPAFKDVPATHWAYDYINEAVAKGIVNGYSNGTFKPNDPVTVAEFLKMIFLSMSEKDPDGRIHWNRSLEALVPDWARRALYDPRVSFTQGTPWYINYAESSKAMGVIHEYEYEKHYDDKLTRLDAAYMIDNLDSYFHGNIDFGYADVAGPQLFKDLNRANGLAAQRKIASVALRGIMVGSNGYFNPTTTITRAEAVKIVALLPDVSKRSKVNVSLKGVPYSMVTNPGYQSRVFVFANEEMKVVYDKLRAAQSSYQGSTDEENAGLSYYENADQKAKAFHQLYYVDMSDTGTYTDMYISFTGNNYTLNLITVDGYAERALKPLYQMIDILYKDSAPVKKMIESAIAANRKGQAVDVKKTLERRDILLYAPSNADAISISIGAYGDK